MDIKILMEKEEYYNKNNEKDVDFCPNRANKYEYVGNKKHIIYIKELCDKSRNS